MIKTVTLIGIPRGYSDLSRSGHIADQYRRKANHAGRRFNHLRPYGVVQRLILIGCYVIMGFMQGYSADASLRASVRRRRRPFS